MLFLPDLGCCSGVLLDFQLVLVLTRVIKVRTGEVGFQLQPEPSVSNLVAVRFCQDGKEDRSPKKSVKIKEEQGLARHSFTLVNSVVETRFASWGEKPHDNLHLGKFGKQRRMKMWEQRMNSEKVCHLEVFFWLVTLLWAKRMLPGPYSRELLQEKHIGQLSRKPGKLWLSQT